MHGPNSTIRRLRERRGFTLEALAYLAGIDAATLSRVERRLVRPRPENVVRIARALGVSVRRIVDESGRGAGDVVTLDAPLPYGDLPPVLDVPDTAAVLACHPDTVRAVIARGELRSVRLGRLVRVPRHELIAFLERRQP